MNVNVPTVIGLVAAALTSLAYLPQAYKVIRRGSTHDLSLKTLAALCTGLALGVCYGFLIDDAVIILANAVGASLAGFVLACKLRDLSSQRSR